MKRELYRRIFTVLFSIFSCILSISIILNFVFYPVNSRSDSMSPDIPENSIVLVTPLLKSADRGDIMLVKKSPDEKKPFYISGLNLICRFFTAQQYSPFEDENSIAPSLRRVIGIPGDSLYINNHIVYIKPRGSAQFLTEFELTKITYSLTVPDTAAEIDKKVGAPGTMEMLELGEGEYFVLGDNRLEAIDSRIWGPAKIKDFKGKSLLIYFPFSKARVF